MNTPTAKSRVKAQVGFIPTCLLHLIIFLCSAGPLPAQVPIQLTVELSGTNVVPPSGSGVLGTGSLTLIGNNLAYNILLSYPKVPLSLLELRGPAAPGANAPLIASLGSCGQ